MPSFKSVNEVLGDFNLERRLIIVTYSGGFSQNAVHFIDLVLFWSKFQKPIVKSVTGDPAGDDCAVNFGLETVIF